MEFCKLLAKPDKKETLVNGVPEGVLAEVLLGTDDDVRFVKWNGEDPSPELMAWMKKRMLNVRPASRLETLERRPLGARSWYRDTVDGKFGILIEVGLKGSAESWKVVFRRTSGPSMAGGGWSGKIGKSYGYWYRHDVEGWTE